MSASRFSIPASHPCLPGHFPGQPIVPGVVLLDAVLDAAGRHYPARAAFLRRCKFLAPLAPDTECEISFAPEDSRHLRFSCTAAGRLLARGQIDLQPDSP